MPDCYDALLIVSFGGPECRDDVLPFLENVLRGKNVPRSRMLEVAEHYYHFEGVSPINAQTRSLIAALRSAMDAHGISLPIYWGNRNWHPRLADTVRQMRDEGIRRALAFVTSIFSSYSGCRQYLEDIERARTEVGEGAPPIDKLRAGFNHPDFISAMANRVQDALEQVPAEFRPRTHVVYTAHSIPRAMAQGCPYEMQLDEACRLVSDFAGCPEWSLAFQSRSGPPTQPWLEPDLADCLRQIQTSGAFRAVVVAPIGFISDHMEVLYDLDVEAKDLCESLGLSMVRAGTVGTHPQFVQMIIQLIQERRNENLPRCALGNFGPSPDVCPMECCPSGRPR